MIAASKSAVEHRKATTMIFKCVSRSAVAIEQFMLDSFATMYLLTIA
jgi:hypothetical protein